MAFVLEYPTDEQREEQGFARTADDADNRLGIKYVSTWAIDREKNADITIISRRGCFGELHWNNSTIKIKSKRTIGTDIPDELRAREEKRTGQHLGVVYEIIELIVPEELKNNLDEIKKLIAEGLNIFGKGSLKFYGTGYTIFSSELEVRYSKLIKSEVKLRDFATTH